MQKSASGMLSAKVSMSRAESNTTVLKEEMEKYYHILEAQFQDFLEVLEAVGVTLQRKKDLFFARPPKLLAMRLGSPTPSMMSLES